MKLAISNIAWQDTDENEIFDIMRRLDIKGLEIAPTRLFTDPTKASHEKVQGVKAKLQKGGFEVVAAQSLIYGHPELKLFTSAEVRLATLAYLEKIINLCAQLGAGALVFGSPKNRQRAGMPHKQALDLAIEFFNQAGEIAQSKGTTLCIEANPPEYQCDFIQTTHEALELVKAVNHPGFRLHLDTSSMRLNGEDPEKVIAESFEWVRHIHFSEPYLGLVGADENPLQRQLAGKLKSLGYAHWVSVEMRAGLLESNPVAVETALNYMKTLFD